MIGFPLGLVTANFTEWAFHKYVLHGLGRNKRSFWSFHWGEHHRECRKNDNYDASYEKNLFQQSSKRREAMALVGAGVAMLPLFPFAPGFVSAVWLHGAGYYYVHRKSHVDPEWAKRWLPWHYDHHMGSNQHANWCVTYPLADYFLGTRELGPATAAKSARAVKNAPQPSAAPA